MKSWIIIGSILAALAVILGAFGAHGLKTRLSPEDLAIFETGVRYHIIHALGIIIIGVLGYHEPSEILKVPVIFFTIGIFLFSGSLYILILFQVARRYYSPGGNWIYCGVAFIGL